MYSSVLDLTNKGDSFDNLGTSKLYNSNVSVLTLFESPGDTRGRKNINGYLMF